MGQTSAKFSFGKHKWSRTSSRPRRLRESSLWRQPKDEECVVIPFPPKGSWKHHQEIVDECEMGAGIPADNAEAIALLESWLKMPSIDNEFSQSIRKGIDENRLSDRKFFS